MNPPRGSEPCRSGRGGRNGRPDIWRRLRCDDCMTVSRRAASAAKEDVLPEPDLSSPRDPAPQPPSQRRSRIRPLTGNPSGRTSATHLSCSKFGRHVLPSSVMAKRPHRFQALHPPSPRAYTSRLRMHSPSAWCVWLNRSAALTLSIQKPFFPSPSASAFLALSRTMCPTSRACVWTCSQTKEGSVLLPAIFRQSREVRGQGLTLQET